MSRIEANSGLIELYAKQLRLPSFTRYQDVVRQLGNDQSYDDFLLAMMKQEAQSRQESSQRRKTKAAKFPYIKTMDELDMARFENLNASFLNQLATCDFVSKRQNIVMIGNSGTGKTHLSIALGLKACMAGMDVRFFTAANLSNQLVEAQEYKKLMKLEKQLMRADLLIIDEMSYLTFNRHQSELLFKVVSDRAEKQSVIVSTNLKFSEWTTIFENSNMVSALIDRLTFRSHVLNMNGRSFRSDHVHNE
ncbi:MAG: IS21-like element helper ATPase IstB [Youngiibacter sp.]|nr:IS21-like element helper ATPase IstB [Youngiibacter sp.]